MDTVRTGESVRHDAVLEAVAHAAERLLLAADWREVPTRSSIAWDAPRGRHERS